MCVIIQYPLDKEFHQTLAVDIRAKDHDKDKNKTSAKGHDEDEEKTSAKGHGKQEDEDDVSAAGMW